MTTPIATTTTVATAVAAPVVVDREPDDGMRRSTVAADLTSQLRDLLCDIPGAVTSLHRSPVRALVALTWLAGIVGDAHTTISMMSTGLYEEANPVAAAGMAVLGVVGYTLVVSLACGVLALIAVARPRGLYGHTVVLTLATIGVAKAYTALSNLLLWTAPS